MAHVVVLGAGLGGTIMAYEMKDQLRPGDTLTVVTKDPKYHFVPSNPWVAVGWREARRHRGRPRARSSPRRASPSSRWPRRKLHPESNTHRARGRHIGRPTTTSSSPPARNSPSTRSRASGPRATPSRSAMSRMRMKAHEAFEAFCKNPGPIIVGAVQGASCFGPAYEFALHPRDRAAPPQDPRPRADDLRHRRALYRPSRPRRRGRHQGPARKRDAREAHQVDHQRRASRRSRPAR